MFDTTSADHLTDLVSGFDAFVGTEDELRVQSDAEAPAATTTFCAFTVSYMFTRATVADGC